MVVARKYTVGDSRLNNKGEKFTIIQWDNAHKVIVKFDNGEVVETTSSTINSGSLLNRYSPTIFGVGITEGWFVNGRDSTCREYQIWTSMLARVCNKRSKYYELYSKCSISEDWFYLKNFGEWVTNLPQWKFEGWHLDKDICRKSLYSEDTCFLIPSSINCLLTSRGKRIKNNGLPRGVRKAGNKYEGRYGGGDRQTSKSFSSIEEAYDFHLRGSKEILLREVDKYRNDLDPRCAELLINFKMEEL